MISPASLVLSVSTAGLGGIPRLSVAEAGGVEWVWGCVGEEEGVDGVWGVAPCVSHTWVRILSPSAMTLQILHLQRLFGFSIWWMRVRCFSTDVTAAVSFAWEAQEHMGH